MKVQNMTSSSGNKVANQFILSADYGDYSVESFQSYDSLIVMKEYNNQTGDVRTILDSNYWDYSVITSKYRNQFLGETKKETQAKIDSGEYVLADLNS